jgi:PAS domain S-box-containing protein
VIREMAHSSTFDLWTVGVILFEMAVGRTPFVPADSENAHGLFVNILMHPPRFPDGWGGDLEGDGSSGRSRGGASSQSSPPPELEPRLPCEARSLVNALLSKKPEERLGSARSGGWAAVKRHPFFSGPAGSGGGGGGVGGDPEWTLPAWDWELAAARQMPPPRLPSVGTQPTDGGGGNGGDGGDGGGDEQEEASEAYCLDLPGFASYVSPASLKEQSDAAKAAEAEAAVENKAAQAAEAKAGAAGSDGVGAGASALAGASLPSPGSQSVDSLDLSRPLPSLSCRRHSGETLTHADIEHLKLLELREHMLADDLESVQQRLESRERAMEVVLNLVPQALCAKDSAGKYLLANKKMAALYGMAPAELEGKNQLEVAKSAAEAREMLEVDQQVIRDGRSESLSNGTFLVTALSF